MKITRIKETAQQLEQSSQGNWEQMLGLMRDVWEDFNEKEYMELQQISEEGVNRLCWLTLWSMKQYQNQIQEKDTSVKQQIEQSVAGLQEEVARMQGLLQKTEEEKERYAAQKKHLEQQLSAAAERMAQLVCLGRAGEILEQTGKAAKGMPAETEVQMRMTEMAKQVLHETEQEAGREELICEIKEMERLLQEQQNVQERLNRKFDAFCSAYRDFLIP